MTDRDAALVGGLGIGALIRHDSQSWRIVELEGMQAVLLGVFTERTRNVALAELVYSPGYRLIEPAQRSGPLRCTMTKDDDDPRAWLAWEAIPRPARLEAERLEPHVLEMRDGYRSGESIFAAADEPRPGYGPETSITERVALKHRELKGTPLQRGLSTLWAYLADYERFGTIGLVDRRRCAAPSAVRSMDPGYRRAILDVLQAGVNDSKRDFWWLHRQVRGLLRSRFGDRLPEIPKFGTFVSHVKLLDIEGVASNLRRKTIHGNQTRVAHAYRAVESSHVGELFELDATPTDLFTLDEKTGGWTRTWILGVIDTCARNVRVRLLSHPATALDAVLLLCDAMRPIPFSNGHLSSSAWHLMGVPEELVCFAIEEEDPSADQPILHAPFCAIDAVTTDRAWLTGSRLLRDACRKFGITLNVARKKKGSDKPHIERFFRTLRESFLMRLPGYTGQDLHNRGVDPHLQAVYFRGELEHAIERWIVGIYANSPIRDLRVPHIDGDVSPNTAWAESVTRTGFLRVPTESRAWLELLPAAGATIQHYGVEAHGLPYDGPCLEKWRGMPCEYPGHLKGKWPLRYDPRELRYLYFRDPVSGEWGRLTRRKARDPSEPFGQRSVLAAKHWVSSTGGDELNTEEVSAALDLLLDDLEAGARVVGNVRRALVDGAQRGESARHDHDGMRFPAKTSLPPTKAATRIEPESTAGASTHREPVRPYDFD